MRCLVMRRGSFGGGIVSFGFSECVLELAAQAVFHALDFTNMIRYSMTKSTSMRFLY